MKNDRGSPPDGPPDGELTPDEARQRRVRSRTLRHLRKWLLIGAAGGTAALGSAACHSVVCDPLPDPLECPLDGNDSWTLSERLSLQAWWANPAEWQIHVEARLHLWGDDADVTFTGPPQVLDATLLAHNLTDTELAFDSLPPTDASELEVVLPMSCDSAGSTLQIRLSLYDPPVDGGSIPVNLVW